MRNFRSLVLGSVLVSLTPLSWGEEDYFMTTSYRCLADYEGGVNHKKRGHDPGKFRPDLEFRLVHRTALPEKLLSTWSQYNLFEPNIISSNDSIKLEEHTYFLRSVADNPNMGANWLKCYAQRWEEIPTKSNITCSEHLEKVDELFRFNLVTKNFTYAYLGSWDLPREERNYFGDSSVFAFGTCKPYYD